MQQEQFFNEAAYEALHSHAVVGRRSNRTHLEVTGVDRASFLHNLCTNHVKGLTAGQGCEAFFCNAQAKVQAFVDMFCLLDSLVMETVPGQANPLLAHLDRYLFREQVRLQDRSEEWDEWLLAGPRSTELLRKVVSLELPRGDHEHCGVMFDGESISLRRLATHHEQTWQLVGTAAVLEGLVERLRGVGAVSAEESLWEVARVERGTPEFGHDISSENLPPELQRNERAISYQKGCYLGQEPIARIDALGHVNWFLTGLICPGPQLATNFLLASEGKALARITSVVYSPQLAKWIALAFVRRGAGAVDGKLIADQGTFEIVGLPFPLPS